MLLSEVDLKKESVFSIVKAAMFCAFLTSSPMATLIVVSLSPIRNSNFPEPL